MFIAKLDDTSDSVPGIFPDLDLTNGMSIKIDCIYHKAAGPRKRYKRTSPVL